MLTPLAPSTEVMTPWAKTFVAAKAASRMDVEYCILEYVREMKFLKRKTWYYYSEERSATGAKEKEKTKRGN